MSASTADRPEERGPTATTPTTTAPGDAPAVAGGATETPTGAPPGGSQVTRMVDRGDVPSGGGQQGGHQFEDRPEERIETVGGQVYRGGRLIGYTDKGAVSATEGGVIDPTVVPGGHTVTDPNPFEEGEGEEKQSKGKK